MNVRLIAATAMLLGIYGGARFLSGKSMPTEVINPQRHLKDMPRRLGVWQSKDDPLDPYVFRHIGATDAINRVCRDALGNSVSMHVAVFNKYPVYGVPHSPEECFPSGGYHVLDTRSVTFNSSEQSPKSACLLSLEQHEQPVYCLFWYQFGDVTFSDAQTERRLVLGFRGRKTAWPLLIKVMLTTSATSPERAERLLDDLAKPVFAWTKEFH